MLVVLAKRTAHHLLCLAEMVGNLSNTANEFVRNDCKELSTLFGTLSHAHFRMAWIVGGYPEYPPGGPKGPVYDPTQDHPLLIPSVAIPRPGFGMKDFMEAVTQAKLMFQP